MASDATIERHHETLKRLLAIMLVYIGLADDTGQAMRFLLKTATAFDMAGGVGGGEAPLRAFRAMDDPWTIRAACIG